MPESIPIAKLSEYVGKEIGLTDWLVVDQKRISAFAECTDDRQWIHVDPEKAKLGPFGTTIAHGFLTLSMLPYFGYQNKVRAGDAKMAVNYGLNKVRFLNPVKVGSRIRNRAVLKSVENKGPGRFLLTTENTVEIEGGDKPAMIAETLTMLFA